MRSNVRTASEAKTAAAILRRVREAHGMTQAELAEAAGVSVAGLAKAEAGIVGMGLDMALRVSRALGMSAGWLDGVALEARP